MWGQPSIGCGEEGVQGAEGQAGVVCQSLGGVEGFLHGRASRLARFIGAQAR